MTFYTWAVFLTKWNKDAGFCGVYVRLFPAHLEGDFEEMESRLGYLEALCLQCEQQTAKQQHINQSENYKKKKRYDSLFFLLNEKPLYVRY